MNFRRRVVLVVAVLLSLATLDAFLATTFDLGALRSSNQPCEPFVPAGYGDAPTISGTFSLAPLGLRCSYISQDGTRHSTLQPDWSITIELAVFILLAAATAVTWRAALRRDDGPRAIEGTMRTTLPHL